MRIRSVRTYLVEAMETLPKSFIFCRVEANDGALGWGEAYAIPGRERGIAEFVKGLGGMLMSLDEASPQNFRNNVKDGFDEGHLSIDFSSAVSALEVALWDIQGKRAGQPVCELLGSVVSRSVPLYANMEPLAPDESIGQLVARCIAIRQLGFDAVKVYPMEYEPLHKATECIRRIRQAIGSDARLLIDVWALDSPESALQAARAFAPYNPFWFEEPIAGERVDEMAEIRRLVDMPIVTGERQAGMHHFRSVLDQQAADILNPDIVAAGGLQDMIEIGRLAESRGAKISPHCWNSTLVATAAMIHAIAVLPNAIIGEYFPQYAPLLDGFGQLQLDISNGTATIGDTPGLGVIMDDDALARHEI
jgi:galactonate dehydratase